MSETIKSTDVRPKRSYDPAGRDDGRRVLVERLWPRGLSKAEANIDEWLKDLAPSTELRDEPCRSPDALLSRKRRERVSQSGASFADSGKQLFAHGARPIPRNGCGASYAGAMNAIPEIEPACCRHGKHARETGVHSVS